MPRRHVHCIRLPVGTPSRLCSSGEALGSDQVAYVFVLNEKDEVVPPVKLGPGERLHNPEQRNGRRRVIVNGLQRAAGSKGGAEDD